MGVKSLGARLRRIDLAGLRLARTAGHTPRAERAVRLYSRAGEHAVGWLLLGVLGAARARDAGRRRAWRRATATIAASYLVNQAIKLAVRRRRPRLVGLPPLIATRTQLSFPSAHATSSTAAALAFDGLLPRAPLRLAATAMALSRVYLGVHFPSDVLAGVALGTTIGQAAR